MLDAEAPSGNEYARHKSSSSDDSQDKEASQEEDDEDDGDSGEKPATRKGH